MNEEGYRAPPLLHFFTERYRASYAEEIRSFLDLLPMEHRPETAEDLAKEFEADKLNR